MHPGLCASCVHARSVATGRSTFSLCERGLRGEPGYARYPRLPVLRCGGHVAADEFSR